MQPIRTTNTPSWGRRYAYWPTPVNTIKNEGSFILFKDVIYKLTNQLFHVFSAQIQNYIKNSQFSIPISYLCQKIMHYAL